MNDNASLAVGGPSRSGIGGLPQRLVQDGLVEESAMAQALSDAKDKRTSVVSQLIAKGIVTAMEHPAARNEDFNLSTAQSTTVLELAEVVLEVSGADVPVTFDPLPIDDPTRRRPDITLAGRELGWKPEVDLQAGITQLVEWYRTERPATR